MLSCSREVLLSEFILRKAYENDFPKIKKLISDVKINPTGLDWHRFIVAETPTGDFVGCGQLKPHSGDIVELASIAVVSSARNQGIGEIIIRKLVSETKLPIYLTCRSPLGSYYQRFGFRKIAGNELPDYFRRLSRLANLINALHIVNDQMLVMILEQETYIS